MHVSNAVAYLLICLQSPTSTTPFYIYSLHFYPQTFQQYQKKLYLKIIYPTLFTGRRIQDCEDKTGAYPKRLPR